MSFSGQADQPDKRIVRRVRRKRLAGRLARAFVLITASMLLLVGAVLTFVSYNIQSEQIVIRQQKTADEAALLTWSYLSRALDTLKVYGEVGAGRGLLLLSMGSQLDELGGLMANYPDMYESVTLLDADGEELAKVSGSRRYALDELRSRASAPAFREAVLGSPYIANEVQISGDGSLPVIEMAAPVRGIDRPGVLVAEVNVQGMWDAVSGVEVGKTGYAYIVDRDTGKLIAHSNPARHAAEQGKSMARVSIVRQLMRGETGFESQYPGLDGVPVLGAVSQVPTTNWALVVELPAAEALAGVRQMLFLLGGLLILGVIAAGSLGFLVLRRIVRPLLALQEGAHEIGAGYLDRVIEMDTGDELQDLAEAFNDMAGSLKESRAELERWGHELEDRVNERTRELAEASERMRRRAIQVETSAEVARAIASVRGLDVLLPQVTQLISERFGWYHVGIFLVDEQGEYAVLEAANSEGGRRMLARGHKLKIGQVGIVGAATASGEALSALDVGDNPVYFDNPDLPDTRSEMALPLIVGNEIIGALDVQSNQPAAYDEEDLAVAGILADQVAIALRNARLFEQTQHALKEVQALHRSYVQREWAEEIKRRRALTFEYRRRGTQSQPAVSVSKADLALTRGEAVAAGDHRDELSPVGGELAESHGGNGDEWQPPKSELTAPIKVRDQIIGVLNLQEEDVSRQWTEDDLALVRAVTDEMGQALETARLIEETSRRAEQMSTLNRIGMDLATGLELERVLQSLYQQCRQVLPTDLFYVALFDEYTGHLEFPLVTGDEGPINLDTSRQQQESKLAGHVIETGKPLHVPDTQSAPEDIPHQSLLGGESTGRSYLAVPLRARGRVIGVLSVQSRAPNAYATEDVELLTTIATQASIALENARAYERLVEIADELRELDRLKTQFLANMSHELRTPLNSIIGFARVMLKGIDGPLTEFQEADLNSIYTSGQHLLGLINSILDMSKIEAGKMDLAFEEVVLPQVIEGAMSVATALVKDKPVELVSALDDDLPTVWADSQRVRQILLNLLSNAAKFTEQGKIVLRAETGAEFVTISVSDTGIGIPHELQDQLFIAFQQVDGSTTRRAQGTGLGLAISRSFVELLNGKIWVESEPGKGSTFYFTLPTYNPPVDREGLQSRFDLEPGKRVVLVIDDDAGVITLFERYLQYAGYHVVGLTHSPEALEIAQQLAPSLAAITLDIVMPELDGWQVLRALKQEAKTRDIPVVLCSIVDDLEQGLQMGASACLRKPITRDEILSVLERLT